MDDEMRFRLEALADDLEDHGLPLVSTSLVTSASPPA
jgi:hypothetical protein